MRAIVLQGRLSQGEPVSGPEARALLQGAREVVAMDEGAAEFAALLTGLGVRLDPRVPFNPGDVLIVVGHTGVEKVVVPEGLTLG